MVARGCWVAPRVLGWHTATTHCLPALIIAPFFLRFLRARGAPLGCRLYVVLRSCKHVARGARRPRRVSRLAWGTPRPVL